VRGIWQMIALHAVPHSQAEYERVIGLQEKLYNSNSVVFLAVLVWFIVCLWIDEPGTGTPATAGAEALPAEADGVGAAEEK
jgi:membrane protein required for beta-lactamase induction